MANAKGRVKNYAGLKLMIIVELKVYSPQLKEIEDRQLHSTTTCLPMEKPIDLILFLRHIGDNQIVKDDLDLELKFLKST